MGQQLEICAAVMSDGTRFELMLLDKHAPVDEGHTAALIMRGLRYAGIFLYKNGQTGTRLDPGNPLTDEALASATWAFALIVVSRIRQKSQSWLDTLHALTDARPLS